MRSLRPRGALRPRLSTVVWLPLLCEVLIGCGKTTDDPTPGVDAGGASPGKGARTSCAACVIIDQTPRFDATAGPWPGEEEGGVLLVELSEGGAVARSVLGLTGAAVHDQGWGPEHRWLVALGVNRDGASVALLAEFFDGEVVTTEIELPLQAEPGTWSLDLGDSSDVALLSFRESVSGFRRLFSLDLNAPKEREPSLLAEDVGLDFQRIQRRDAVVVSRRTPGAEEPCDWELFFLSDPSQKETAFAGGCEGDFVFGGQDERWVAFSSTAGEVHTVRLLDAEDMSLVGKFQDVVPQRILLSGTGPHFVIAIDRQLTMGDVSWTETSLLLGDLSTGSLWDPTFTDGFPGGGIQSGYKSMPCGIRGESLVVSAGGDDYEGSFSDEPWVRLDAPPGSWAFCLGDQLGFVAQEEVQLGEQSFPRPGLGEGLLSEPEPWPGGLSFSLYGEGNSAFYVALFHAEPLDATPVLRGVGTTWSTIPFDRPQGGVVWQYEQPAFWVSQSLSYQRLAPSVRRVD